MVEVDRLAGDSRLSQLYKLIYRYAPATRRKLWPPIAFSAQDGQGLRRRDPSL